MLCSPTTEETSKGVLRRLHKKAWDEAQLRGIPEVVNLMTFES